MKNGKPEMIYILLLQCRYNASYSIGRNTCIWLNFYE